MRLKIKSNYWEPWHSAFDHDGYEFRMMNNEGPDRPAMFNLFKKNEINHPVFGKYSDFLKIGFEKTRNVVIYDDIRSHFGEDKRLCVFSDLNIEDKLKYMCEYVPTSIIALDDYLSQSTRYLVIGDNCFKLNYYSTNDWRSNNGKVTVTNPTRIDPPRWRKNIAYAMFAIDFVGADNALRAIDFNISPGVPSSIHKFLPASQMVLAIKHWLAKYMGGEYGE